MQHALAMRLRWSLYLHWHAWRSAICLIGRLSRCLRHSGSLGCSLHMHLRNLGRLGCVGSMHRSCRGRARLRLNIR